ncbi:hypothetical protein [Salipaludibacillus sp. CF4.18]|uniref:hypothetical protein n=1 Tax=Salipaludibacillus sp. CF4.18 TaxID=3373081 RepID=UPI003EE6C654
MTDNSKSGDLEKAVLSLTNGIKGIGGIKGKGNAKEKLRYVMKAWDFRLPMATAILTVLYPDDFTVYDVRVCEQLGGDHHKLKNRVNFDNIWKVIYHTAKT